MSWQAPSRPGDPTPPQSNHPVPAQTSVRTQLLVCAAIGAVFALVVYVARAPVPRVIGCGLVFAAGSFPLLRAMDLIRVEWPTPPYGRAVRLAGIRRWRLNGFDALTDSRPGLSHDLRSRLRALATAILARHELAPGSARAIALLGAGTHELLYPSDLVGADRPPDPTAAQATVLMDRLIALGNSRPRPGPGIATTPSAAQSSVEREGNR